MKKEKLSVKDLCITALFAAVTAICAQIIIPLPFSPVPISFGMVGLYTAAIFLPPRCAVLSQVCYLILGAAGLPVFGGFKGGIGALLGPTGGYLLVYPIMAAIVSCTLNSGWALQKNYGRKRVLINGTIAICAAHFLLYLGGTIWLCAITGNTFMTGLSLGVFPYIPLDIVKIVFCAAAVIPLRGRLMGAGFLTMMPGKISS